jgi:hypothetical protein
LFEQHRQRQYTRELLFSTVVDLMALVALGLRPSLHAAAQASDELNELRRAGGDGPEVITEKFQASTLSAKRTNQ